MLPPDEPLEDVVVLAADEPLLEVVVLAAPVVPAVLLPVLLPPNIFNKLDEVLEELLEELTDVVLVTIHWPADSPVRISVLVSSERPNVT